MQKINDNDHPSAEPYRFVDDVPVARVFLSLDNPRHETVDSEAAAIEILCAKEDVAALARDIARHGLSPLERFAMLPLSETKGGDATYWVAEGNRRICAIKLLTDPELAPPKLRKTFEKIAEGWAPIKSVPAAVFDDPDTLRVWLDRVHSGAQGGIGRKTWDAEQKQRFSGSSKNKLAQAVLDYAESEGMISREQRQGKLTTVQRFLSSEAVQETIGIDRTNPEEIARTRPKPEFDAILRRFMSDLLEGEKVHSRKNKPDIVKYARTLTSAPGVSATRIESEPLISPPALAGDAQRNTPKRPQRIRHIKYDEEINNKLTALGNDKLQRLYYSVSAIDLPNHTPLIAIGVWAFFETLTAVAGRNDGVSFEAYLDKNRLNSFGISGDNQKVVRAALQRIRDYGNHTKHHAVSAAFNGDQINNDMTTLKQVIIKLVEQSIQNS